MNIRPPSFRWRGQRGPRGAALRRRLHPLTSGRALSGVGVRRELLLIALVAGCISQAALDARVPPGSVVVVAHVDASGRLASVGHGLDGVGFSSDAADGLSRVAWVISPGDYVDPAGRPMRLAELTVSAADEDSGVSGGCRRCLVPGELRPAVALPGAGCPVPAWTFSAELSSPGAAELQSAARAGVRVAWPGPCPCDRETGFRAPPTVCPLLPEGGPVEFWHTVLSPDGTVFGLTETHRLTISPDGDLSLERLSQAFGGLAIQDIAVVNGALLAAISTKSGTAPEGLYLIDDTRPRRLSEPVETAVHSIVAREDGKFELYGRWVRAPTPRQFLCTLGEGVSCVEESLPFGDQACPWAQREHSHLVGGGEVGGGRAITVAANAGLLARSSGGVWSCLADPASDSDVELAGAIASGSRVFGCGRDRSANMSVLLTASLTGTVAPDVRLERIPYAGGCEIEATGGGWARASFALGRAHDLGPNGETVVAPEVLRGHMIQGAWRLTQREDGSLWRQAPSESEAEEIYPGASGTRALAVSLDPSRVWVWLDRGRALEVWTDSNARSCEHVQKRFVTMAAPSGFESARVLASQVVDDGLLILTTSSVGSVVEWVATEDERAEALLRIGSSYVKAAPIGGGGFLALTHDGAIDRIDAAGSSRVELEALEPLVAGSRAGPPTVLTGSLGVGWLGGADLLARVEPTDDGFHARAVGSRRPDGDVWAQASSARAGFAVYSIGASCPDRLFVAGSMSFRSLASRDEIWELSSECGEGLGLGFCPSEFGPLEWGSEDSVLSMQAEGPTLGLSSGKALRAGQPEILLPFEDVDSIAAGTVSVLTNLRGYVAAMVEHE